MASRDLLAICLVGLSCAACHAVAGVDEFAVGDGGVVSSGGSGGTGGGTAPCHPSGLVDDFEGDVIDTALWTVQGAATNIGVSRGFLRITPPPATMAAAWVGLVSRESYDVKECSVWVRIAAVAAGRTYFQLYHGDGPVVFEVQNGIIAMGIGDVKETLSYEPADHQWLRFRDESNSLYFETSPDGIDWTSRHSVPTPLYIGEVEVGLGVVPAPNISMETEAQFDNLDVVP